jgi:hypothetical protein
MTMTIRQILNSTVKSRKFASTFVRVKKVKIGRHKVTNAPVIRCISNSTHNHKGERKNYKPNDYVSTIEVYGRYVVVSCSCDDFWAVSEYALAQRGAARIEYSNGEPPIEKNPQLIPTVCKHLYYLGSTLIAKGKL